MFPGQGSQSKGMGTALFDRFPDWTRAADEILGYSIRELCVDDPREQLGQTRFTQPALFVVNAMTFRARGEDGKPAPAFVAGHSLGEYNALVAAGVLDFTAGLKLVKRRGEIMSEVSGGGMAAVIGLEPKQIEQVLGQHDAGKRLDVANFNSFEQTVIAGPKDDLVAMKPQFDDAGAKLYKVLNVSAPFHSRYMRGAEAAFGPALASVTFNPPAIPVISNATAQPYEPAAARDTLARQIGHSVRWLDSMLYLMKAGATEFEEVGPGNVLGKLILQIKKKAISPAT
jgi:trans-AT polyketide synthase/acyltransferase/oxidoreductase domain-containing protein